MQCETQFPRNSYLKRHLKLLHENTPKQIGRPLKDEMDLSAKNKFMCERISLCVVELTSSQANVTSPL